MRPTLRTPSDTHIAPKASLHWKVLHRSNLAVTIPSLRYSTRHVALSGTTSSVLRSFKRPANTSTVCHTKWIHPLTLTWFPAGEVPSENNLLGHPRNLCLSLTLESATLMPWYRKLLVCNEVVGTLRQAFFGQFSALFTNSELADS